MPLRMMAVPNRRDRFLDSFDTKNKAATTVDDTASRP